MADTDHPSTSASSNRRRRSSSEPVYSCEDLQELLGPILQADLDRVEARISKVEEYKERIAKLEGQISALQSHSSHPSAEDSDDARYDDVAVTHAKDGQMKPEWNMESKMLFLHSAFKILKRGNEMPDSKWEEVAKENFLQTTGHATGQTYRRPAEKFEEQIAARKKIFKDYKYDPNNEKNWGPTRGMSKPRRKITVGPEKSKDETAQNVIEDDLSMLGEGPEGVTAADPTLLNGQSSAMGHQVDIVSEARTESAIAKVATPTQPDEHADIRDEEAIAPARKERKPRGAKTAKAIRKKDLAEATTTGTSKAMAEDSRPTETSTISTKQIEGSALRDVASGGREGLRSRNTSHSGRDK